MPTYQYKCTKCDYDEEINVLIDDRDKITLEPCPNCGEISVERIFGSPIINLGFRGSTIQSKTSDAWKDKLREIKKKAGPKATGIEV